MDADLVLICSNLSAHALGGIDRAADDLAELGERAKARGIRIGFEALVVSPNYYEDLGARFGLEDSFLARLQDARILYDEDTNGHYFHFSAGNAVAKCSSRSCSGKVAMTDMVQPTPPSVSAHRSVACDSKPSPARFSHIGS